MMVSRNRDLAKFWIVMDTYVRPSEKIDQGGFCPGLFLNAVASELVSDEKQRPMQWGISCALTT